MTSGARGGTAKISEVGRSKTQDTPPDHGTNTEYDPLLEGQSVEYLVHSHHVDSITLSITAVLSGAPPGSVLGPCCGSSSISRLHNQLLPQLHLHILLSGQNREKAKTHKLSKENVIERK